MHAAYGGVVPELASRDHIRRLLPLTRALLERHRRCEAADARRHRLHRGPGLAGALLVGAAVARGIGLALGVPAIGVHHLEGHLLSPLLSPPRARVSVRRIAGFGRAHAVDARRRRRATTSCWAKRWTMPPARPSTRARSCWAWVIPAGRRSRSSRRAGGRALRLPRPMLASGRSRFQLQRLEDRGAPARRASARARRGRRAPTSRAKSRPRSSTCSSPRRWPRSSARDSRRLVVAGGVGANLHVARAARRGARRRGDRGVLPGRSNSAPTTAR